MIRFLWNIIVLMSSSFNLSYFHLLVLQKSSSFLTKRVLYTIQIFALICYSDEEILFVLSAVSYMIS